MTEFSPLASKALSSRFFAYLEAHEPGVLQVLEEARCRFSEDEVSAAILEGNSFQEFILPRPHQDTPYLPFHDASTDEEAALLWSVDGRETSPLVQEEQMALLARTVEVIHPTETSCTRALLLYNLPGDHEPLAMCLRSRGVEVQSVHIGDLSPENCAALVESHDTLFYLAHADLWSLEDIQRSKETALRMAADLQNAFSLLSPHLRRLERRVVVPARINGLSLGEESSARLDSFPAGFVRALRREETRSSFVLVDPGDAPWVEVLERAAFLHGGEEFGRVEGQWARPGWKVLREGAEDVQEPLGEGELLLAFGCERGESFSWVRQIAHRTGCRLVLVGETSAARGDEEWLDVGEDDLLELVHSMETERVKTRRASVTGARRFARRVQIQWEIMRNLRLLRDEGIVARYLSCDFADARELQEVLDEASSGAPLRGLMFGANSGDLASDKDPGGANLLRVLEKELGLLLILEPRIDWLNLHLLVSFGPHGGAMGGGGAPHLALSGDMMTWAVRTLAGKYPHLQAQSIEWVSGDDEDPEERIRLFVRALREHPEIPQIAAMKPSLLWQNPTRARRASSHVRARLLGEGGGVRFCARDCFLNQYQVKERATVPPAFVAEVFAEFVGAESVCLEEVDFRLPSWGRGEFLNAEVVLLDEHLYLVPAELKDFHSGGRNLAFASARVGDALQEEGFRPEFSFSRCEDLLRESVFNPTNFYQVLGANFARSLSVGAVFRGLEYMGEADAELISWGVLSLPEEAVEILPHPGDFAFHPVVADLAVQAALACVLRRVGALCSPARMGRVVARRERMSLQRRFVVACREVGVGLEQSTLDVALFDLQGNPVFSIERLDLVTIAR